MIRYFFHIAYMGSHYRGWQRQTNVRSVQEIIETKLGQALKIPSLTIVGCGRTDAGVHASQYIFHTDLNEGLSESRRLDLVFQLNKLLPDDIAFFDIIEMTQNEHSRFGATERVYDYFIHTQKDPFLKNISSLYVDGSNMDYKKMSAAVALLSQYEDYRAFCKKPDLHNTTICKVKEAKLFVSKDGLKLRFQIRANRFLRGQIRIIVQKLIDIGLGKFTVEAFEHALKTQIRPQLINPAHPQGLFLSKVYYPFLNLPVKATFDRSEESWQEI